MNDILNIIPAKYHGFALALLALSPILGRIYHALINGGGVKGIFGAVWLGTNVPATTPAKGNNQIPLLSIMLIGLSAAVLTVGTGCNKGTLQAGGAYAPATFSTNSAGIVTTNATSQPDLAFYVADAAYKLAYQTVDAILQFERNNRAQVAAISPAIKPALDKIRPTLWNIDQRWAFARKAYKANPIPANLSTLQLILGEIQQLVPTVQAAMAPAYSTASTNSVSQ